jgi:hypothetical protein
MNDYDKLDPKSKEFIEWSMTKLDDAQFYHDFVTECLNRAKNFLSYPPDYITARLKEKLIIGSAEHGTPVMHPERVDTELEFEYLDMIGWRLIKEWNEERIRNEQGK